MAQTLLGGFYTSICFLPAVRHSTQNGPAVFVFELQASAFTFSVRLAACVAVRDACFVCKAIQCPEDFNAEALRTQAKPILRRTSASLPTCRYNILESLDKVQVVGALATKEHSMLQTMEKMESEWVGMDLRVMPYKDTGKRGLQTSVVGCIRNSFFDFYSVPSLRSRSCQSVSEAAKKRTDNHHRRRKAKRARCCILRGLDDIDIAATDFICAK